MEKLKKFEATDGQVLLQLSVTAWLQLSFIWQTKESTSSRHEGGPTQKKHREERESLNFGSSFYLFFFSPPPEPALCKLGYPRGLFVLPEVLRPSFILFSWAFSFFVF